MKTIIAIIILLATTLMLFSQENIMIIYGTKDAGVRSNKPNINYSGKKEAVKGFGYGTKATDNLGIVTYPLMNLESSNSSFAPKNAFLLGGFDVIDAAKQNLVDNKVVSARLKIFINYAGIDRNNICVYVRKLLKNWDENTITYNNIYSKVAQNAALTDFVDGKDENACLGTVNVKSNSKDSLQILPCPNAPGFWEIDVTKIFKLWLIDPADNYGLLVDPLWFQNPKYNCSSPINQKANIGDIEIATTEWETWDGKVPSTFEGKWLAVTNKAKGKKEYIPQIIVTFERKIQPIEEETSEGEYVSESDLYPPETPTIEPPIAILEKLNQAGEAFKKKNIDTFMTFVGDVVIIETVDGEEQKTKAQFKTWFSSTIEGLNENEVEVYPEAMFIYYRGGTYLFNWDMTSITLYRVTVIMK